VLTPWRQGADGRPAGADAYQMIVTRRPLARAPESYQRGRRRAAAVWTAGRNLHLDAARIADPGPWARPAADSSRSTGR